MAVLSGFLTQSSVAFSGIENPHLTPEFFDFVVDDIWPYGQSIVGDTLIAPVTTHFPVDANGRAISGFAVNSYTDDFYHRIHITPSRIDLGNIVSTQSFPVNVWNAYLVPRTLNEITGVEEGIQLTGQPEPPFVITALQEREWQVSITPEGSAVLDAMLRWVFNNGDVVGLGVTGNRIQAFAFVPHWADGIVERLTWATDILLSPTGAEQRRSLRIAPRREFDVDVILEGRERQAFDMALFGWSSRVWAMPVWHEIQQLVVGIPAGTFTIPCETAHLDFRVGGIAVLRGESALVSETVEIEEIGTTFLRLKRETVRSWPAGTRLYPVRTAMMATPPEVQRKTDTVQTARITFQVAERCDWPAVLPATQYRGKPVFDLRPEESQDLTSVYQNLLLTLDNGSALPRITDTAGLAFPTNQYRWAHYNRAERAQYRSLLYALRGRQVAVWVCTHSDDLTLVDIITQTSTAMDVANIGYSRFAAARVGRCDFRMQLHDGTVFYRRITGSIEIDAERERLTIDTSFNRQIAPAEIARISWIYLARQDTDAISITHRVDSEGLAQSQQIFRGVRDGEL